MSDFDLSTVYYANMQDPAFQHLRDQGSHFVPGDGNDKAKVVFVGEAPGEQEEKLRLPFVGPSGRRLGSSLESIEMTREDVFITNVLKYRPPQNRDPLPYEIHASLPYLKEELSLVRPKIVVWMGKIAARAFDPSNKYRNLRGIPQVKGDTYVSLVTYHPAAILRDRSLLPEFERHFAIIREAVNGGAYGTDSTPQSPRVE